MSSQVITPRPRRLRFVFRGPEFAFAIPQGDLDALGQVTSRCCDFWNGGNSLLFPVTSNGRIPRDIRESLPEWTIDAVFVHARAGQRAEETLARLLPRERVQRLDLKLFDEFLHPLALQRSFREPGTERPTIVDPRYRSAAHDRLCRVAWGRFDSDDQSFYDEAFDFDVAQDESAHLALVDGQIEGLSPVRQSTSLMRAYSQTGGSFPVRTLWVFDRVSFDSLVHFWNARALMSVWADECRIVGLPREGLREAEVLERIRHWVGRGPRGLAKPELFIAAESDRARAEATAAVESIGFRQLQSKKLTQFFGAPPEGREEPEYWYFQLVDGPVRRGLFVDTVEVVSQGPNTFLVPPPPDLRFRDHGGLIHLELQELPLAVPLNDALARRTYPNGFASKDAITIRTWAPNGPSFLEPVIPTTTEALEDLFVPNGLLPRLSQDGRLAEALIGRLADVDQLQVLASEDAFALLRELASETRKKLARRLASELSGKMSEQRLAELLRREAAFIEIEARTLEQLGNRLNRRPRELAGALSALVEAGVVRRGSAVRCPECRSRQFVPLSEQDERIACRSCRFRFLLPVLANDGRTERPTAYRLDGLMARCMDQDLLPALLTLRWALKRTGLPPEGAFWPGLELVRAGTVEAELDVLASNRSSLILCECKLSADSFDARQARRLLSLRDLLGGQAVFASLRGEFPKGLERMAERRGAELLQGSDLLEA